MDTQFVSYYTRWTVHGDALAALINNYMWTFHFLFSCSLGKIILKQTDNLSKTLQNLSISAATQRQQIAHLVTEMFSKDSCNEKLELFWSNLMNKKIEIDAADKKLTQK